jgi:hypothetical protein
VCRQRAIQSVTIHLWLGMTQAETEIPTIPTDAARVCAGDNGSDTGNESNQTEQHD